MKNITFYLLLFFGFSIYSCGTSDQPVEQVQWYSGGTLHQSTIEEWSKASPENKLATCADYVANVKEYQGDFTQMKIDATEVMNCIEEVSKDGGSTKGNEIAAMCIVTLGLDN